MKKEKIIVFSIIAVILIIAGVISLLISNPFADIQRKDNIKKDKIITTEKKRIIPTPTKSSSPSLIPSISKKKPNLTIIPSLGLNKITPTPAPIISELKIRPTIDPLVRTIPPYMKEYNGKGKINLQKGKISFSVKADWADGQGDTVLFLGNFDGSTRRNLFEVIGLRNLLIFETYDGEGLNNSFEAPDAVLDDEYYGQTYDVDLIWDFTGEKKMKKIYVNGKLNIEIEVEGPAVTLYPKMYVGAVEKLVIE